LLQCDKRGMRYATTRFPHAVMSYAVVSSANDDAFSA